VSNEKTPVWHR